MLSVIRMHTVQAPTRHRRSVIACRAPARSGFSTIEAIIVLLIVMIIVGTLTPSVQKQLTRTRITRAARAVSADLYLAQALAQRARQPVTVAVDSSAKTITMSIHSPDTVLQRRSYGSQSEFKLLYFWASPTAVAVFPNGMSSTTMTIYLTPTTTDKQVRMSRAGQILVLP